MATQGNRDLLLTMKARDDASAQVQRFGNTLSGVNQIAQNTARSMRLFAASVVAHRVGAGLEAIGRAGMNAAKAAFTMASSFDRGMRLVRTQTKMTDGEFGALQKRALALAKDIPLPMEQLSEGLYDILSSMDVTHTQAIRLTRQMAQAAVAGQTDIRSTTRAAVGALNAFDLPLRKTGMVLDTQFQLVKLGVGTYEEFIQVLGEVYPSAVAAGQSLGSMSGAMAFATRNGLQASKAGISVARALDMISRPNYAAAIKKNLGIDIVDQATGKYKDLTSIMEEFSAEMGHLSKPEQREVLADIFGAGEIRANRFFLMALNNTKELSDMTARFGGTKVAGAMTDAYTIMARAIGNQIQKLKNHLFVIVTVLAQHFFPVIRDVLKFGERMLKMFEALPEPVRTLAARVFLLGTAFAVVGGRLLTFAANLMGAQALMLLSENSWMALVRTTLGSLARMGLVIGVIAAIGFALWKLRDNLDEVREFWDRHWDKIVAIAAVGAAAVITSMRIMRSYLAADIVTAFPLGRWQALWINMTTGVGVAFLQIKQVVANAFTTAFGGAWIIFDDFLKRMGAQWAAFRASMAASGGFLEWMGAAAHNAYMAVSAIWKRLIAWMIVQWTIFSTAVVNGWNAMIQVLANGSIWAGLQALWARLVAVALASYAAIQAGTITLTGVMIAGFHAVGVAAATMWSFITGPFGIAIALIAGMVYIIVRNWKTIKTFFVNLFGDIANNIKDWVKDFVRIVGNIWDVVGPVFTAGLKFLWAIVKLGFFALVTPIVAAFKLIVAVIKAVFGPIANFISDHWEEISTGAQDMALLVIRILHGLADGAFRVVGYLVDGVTKLIGLIPGPLGDAADEVRTQYHEVQDAVLSGLDSMERGVESWGKGVGEATQTASSHIARFGGDVDKASSATARFVNHSREKLREWNSGTAQSFDGVSNAFSGLVDDAHWTADEVEKALKQQFKAAQNFQKNFRTAMRRGLSKEAAQDLIDSLGEDAPRAFQLLADSGKKKSKELIEWIEKTGTASRDVFHLDVPKDMQKTVGSINATEEKLRHLREAMGNVPKNINTQVHANTEPARVALMSWISKLNNTEVQVNVGATFGGPQKFHSGGKIPGSTPKDVPIVAQSGEYVVRRDRAKRFGPILELLNSGGINAIGASMKAIMERYKFHNGGFVGRPEIDYNLAAIPAAIQKAKNSKIGGAGSEVLVALGKMFQSWGFRVGEHSAFGSIGKHATNSWHYLNRAIDINWPGAGEGGMLDKLHGWIKSKVANVLELLWRVPGHFNHLHLAMANGGVIHEPVVGRGTRSGRSYSFAERGPEEVKPLRSTKNGGSTNITYAPTFHDSRVDANEAVNEFVWQVRTRGW